MSSIKLPYGHDSLTLDIPDKNLSRVIVPEEPEITEDESSLMQKALENPVKSKRLSDIVDDESTVAVLVSDTTRPAPTSKMLPPLLNELYRGGIKDENITIVFGLGLHRNQTEEEMEKLVGSDIYNRIRCIEHDRERCRHIGDTSNGTPVEVFEEVLDSDVIVCTGNIEFHYYAGYSGGGKAILPAVSSEKTVMTNHEMMKDDKATTGAIESPVRTDIEEAARMVGADFLFNVVLSSQKDIIYATAGDVIEAHRKGVNYLDSIYKVKVEPSDIVVVSPGGYPKDLNLYQAVKGLENAKNAAVEGGSIILSAKCQECLGNAVFEKWTRELETPEETIEKFNCSFELGGHKAANIAKMAKKFNLYLVSNMPEEDAKNAFFKPAKSIQETLDNILAENPDASIQVMPYGVLTLPMNQ